MTEELEKKLYEAANANAFNIDVGDLNTNRDIFIDGAKWMEQQYKKIDGAMKEPAESKDEKIRKALLEMVHDTTGDELWVDYNVHKEDALAWLEKQGEQDNWAEELNTKIKELHKQCLEIIRKYVSPCYDCNNYKGCEDSVAGEQKIAWSDKDEEMCKIALSCIETLEDISNGKNMHTDIKEWLKSLKDRIQPLPKQERRDEEKNFINAIINSLDKDKLNRVWGISFEEVKSWLKSEQLKN